MIAGISHITLTVGDLEKSARFLETVLGATEIYSSGDAKFSLSREKFFTIGDVWICLMEGDAKLERSYNHVAFKIAETDFDECLRRVRLCGLEIREGRSRVSGEGRSIYFYDYDNHLFELHTGTLSEGLASYREIDAVRR